MNAEYLNQQNRVSIPEEILQDTTFEKLYLLVRKSEQRVYSNREILSLPDVVASHKHYHEWSVRKDSCKRLITYLKKKNRFLKILEVGCGNGWLSNKLVEIPQTEVIGLDINLTELQQAACVFTNSNLHFLYGDLRNNILQNMQFDIIIFAASIQYFSSLNEIISLALKNLTAGGEIHIIDSFLYNKKEVETVKRKCREYYKNIGFPEMADYFFHHLLDETYHFNCTIVHQRNSFFKKLFLKKNIFPWLCIRHV
ncbi:MAG TPA: methyltransferase domain-containing protein [Chitinophagaceae bacterium]|jgi:ubiquinone/menaquinone biosynthesis C-methylase UbiE|nr:methyltransferase domain-containing protein [Chitinophagaceae bacterium]